MSDGPVIVNYSGLKDSTSFTEAVSVPPAGGAADEVAEGQLTPGERAVALAMINNALLELQRSEVAPDVLSAPDDQVASLLQAMLAEDPELLKGATALAAGGQEVRYDNRDLGWYHAAFGWLKERLEIGRFTFLPPPVAPTPLPDEARIGVLGDWGTGMYGAPVCSASISADPAGFQAMVHIGDVYYAGTEKEVRENFLAKWPFIDGAINRACNSNHEMYSGGVPYATITLPKFEQPSSVWWLENAHWTLVGLDSAYDDGRVGATQVQWLDCVTAAAREEGRKVILFTHHQLFSHLDAEGRHLAQDLDAILSDGRIFAWYWGHEHACTIFDPDPTWGLYGRCIGHSGYPYKRPHLDRTTTEPAGTKGALWHRMPAGGMSPAGWYLDGPNTDIPGHQDTFGPHGYAVLELSGADLVERVCAADGSVLRSNDTW